MSIWLLACCFIVVSFLCGMAVATKMELRLSLSRKRKGES